MMVQRATAFGRFCSIVHSQFVLSCFLLVSFGLISTILTNCFFTRPALLFSRHWTFSVNSIVPTTFVVLLFSCLPLALPKLTNCLVFYKIRLFGTIVDWWIILKPLQHRYSIVHSLLLFVSVIVMVAWRFTMDV
jgi:hypothetical protein